MGPHSILQLIIWCLGCRLISVELSTWENGGKKSSERGGSTRGDTHMETQGISLIIIIVSYLSIPVERPCVNLPFQLLLHTGCLFDAAVSLTLWSPMPQIESLNCYNPAASLCIRHHFNKCRVMLMYSSQTQLIWCTRQHGATLRDV